METPVTRSLLGVALLIALGGLLPAHANTVSFDFAQVGNAGNAPDPETGFGAVAYGFAISETEVTNAQYAEFLNAVDPTGTNLLGLFNDTGFAGGMSGNFGGISNTGPVNGSRYVVKAGRENHPVTFVSWFDSVRFINWLHNGQGAGDTETGAYTLLGATPFPSNGLDVERNSSAKYWLPRQDEWYKAAYHDISAGANDVYFDFATGTNTIPYSDDPNSLNTPDNTNVANFFANDSVSNGFNDGYAVSGSTSLPTDASPFTNVGAYTQAMSPYGTFDQNGNVYEWNEDIAVDVYRQMRGGSWDALGGVMAASYRTIGYSSLIEDYWVGFRVTTIPEPSSVLMAACFACAMVTGRTRWISRSLRTSRSFRYAKTHAAEVGDEIPDATSLAPARHCSQGPDAREQLEGR